LTNALAQLVHGADWRAERGIVAASGHKRLGPETAPITEAAAKLPELQFFSRMNPGHAHGDMLVRLCPRSARNWLHAGLRAAGRAMRR
jgi:hypothetical protein